MLTYDQWKTLGRSVACLSTPSSWAWGVPPSLNRLFRWNMQVQGVWSVKKVQRLRDVFYQNYELQKPEMWPDYEGVV